MQLAQALNLLRTRPYVVPVMVMRSWAGLPVRERTQNRGRWVDAIVSMGGGDPSLAGAWCAYAGWAAWHQGLHSLGLRLVTPTSGGVVRSWHQTRGTPAHIRVEEVRDGRVELRPGDLYIRTRLAEDAPRVITGGTSLGHMGMVVSGTIRDGWIHTVEGNTSSGDSRDGDGVYEKTRGIRLDDPRLVGFIRPQWEVLV